MNLADAQRLQQLEDQQAVRICISDYMRLCDDLNSPANAQAIGELFTENACWEGIGDPYASVLGGYQGRTAIVRMMQRYVRQPAHFAMNAHFLCSEAIVHEAPGRLRGRWLMLQTSAFSAGGAHLSAAEIVAWFVHQGDAMQMAHFTTRRLFGRPVSHWNSTAELPVPAETPRLAQVQENQHEL